MDSRTNKMDSTEVPVEKHYNCRRFLTPVGDSQIDPVVDPVDSKVDSTGKHCVSRLFSTSIEDTEMDYEVYPVKKHYVSRVFHSRNHGKY